MIKTLTERSHLIEVNRYKCGYLDTMVENALNRMGGLLITIGHKQDIINAYAFHNKVCKCGLKIY